MRPEIYRVGPVEHGRLAIVPRPRGGDWLADELQGVRDVGRNVAVHCRMSIGRAPLIAASLLVLTGTAPAEAWRRVREARGTSVPDTAAQWVWVEEFARFAREPGTQRTYTPCGWS